SSLPSRQALSAALTSFDSVTSHHFTSAATGASVKLNLIGNGSYLSPPHRLRARLRETSTLWFPRGDLVSSYATGSESSSIGDSKKIKISQRIRKKEEEKHIKDQGTRICIAIRYSITRRRKLGCLPPHSRYAAMPDTRTLYTVLRSPHVDKKSREQFEMRFKKRFLVIKAQSHELSKKLFWLKRYRILGAQYELQFHCKTRLDMSPVFSQPA
ncbi:LOW QUALITY PROTEIN: hypothetical protein HID58_095838, partial [Brassica napus]